jgi:hypothetical protein
MTPLRQALLIAGIVLAAPAALWAQQYDSGDPTAAEQLALEYINRARANPTAEGTRLSITITEGLTGPEATDTGPRPPLAMNKFLLASARAHSQDMWTRNYFAHDTLSPPTQTWDQRITAYGYSWTLAGENIAASSSATAAQLEDNLMLDSGYPGRGHRKNLLDIDPTSTTYFREIGVGYYSGTSSQSNSLKDLLTEDFGRNSAGPFIVGVVYNDTNSNSFYDIGEGMAGVTIRLNPAGAAFAVSGTAGGYAFPAPTSGSITIEATGGPFGTAVATKTITPAFPGENVKVDFKLSDAVIVDSDGDGLPDSWEIAHFGNLAQTAAGDPDGDGYSNLAEFNAGTDPKNAASNPGAAPPAPAKSGGGGGGGGCGLTGLEAFLLLGLLRAGRR